MEASKRGWHQNIKGTSKHMGGVQTYRGPSVTHMGIQTYRGCPNIWGHPNNFNRLKSVASSATHMGNPNKQGSIQTYGESKHKGRHPNIWRPSAPYMANGNLKDALLDWHRLQHIFQRLVNEVLSGFTFAFGYLDDILVFSLDMISHLEHLRLLFERLRTTALKLKEVKCNFLKRHIQYLGHIVSGEGITPLPEKLNSIQKMLPPKTPKEIKPFLGLIGYIESLHPDFWIWPDP